MPPPHVTQGPNPEWRSLSNPRWQSDYVISRSRYGQRTFMLICLQAIVCTPITILNLNIFITEFDSNVLFPVITHFVFLQSCEPLLQMVIKHIMVLTVMWAWKWTLFDRIPKAVIIILKPTSSACFSGTHLRVYDKKIYFARKKVISGRTEMSCILFPPTNWIHFGHIRSSYQSLFSLCQMLRDTKWLFWLVVHCIN